MESPREVPTRGTQCRPRALGKFLYLGERRLHLNGVTYGPFRPDASGSGLGDPDEAHSDLARMREVGVNVVRTYEVPRRWFLEAAWRKGLRVLVGLPWEQHVTFLDEPARAGSIEAGVRAGVQRCAGHPAVLGFAVGNEIPAPIVRWHGRHRIEDFLARLCSGVRREDPNALVTYVNYPTTEYLELPFLDFVSFNVFLENERELRAYVARLQNRCGNRPLVLTELGLDSARNGEEEQARSLRRQLRTARDGGCAGAFLFSWTDEWHRGGEEISDWSFGITRRDREAKPALEAVSKAFLAEPVPDVERWPRVSVVVCTHNGARTIRECLDGLARLAYPDYEVIVVDDGSSDGMAEILEEYPVKVICTPNGGLSRARNLGLSAATGEIVAYIDDDAYPDPHWLHYLAATFAEGDYVAAGGPNIPPPEADPVAECVARAPGGPVHVLLSDREAEHLPGCNMAFRTECLRAIGGFDPIFRVAGDDVDVCWRLREQGWKLAYSPGAVVWHHRRGSISAFLKQQRGYGRAEALLERKWPEKYTRAGHVSWHGRIYGAGGEVLDFLPGRTRIYHGTWGSAPFQSLHRSPPGPLASLAPTLESPLLIGGLLAIAALGLSWPPLLWAFPVVLLLCGGLLWRAVRDAGRAWSGVEEVLPRERRRTRALTAFLHVAQPMARLVGRLEWGLSPWRLRGPGKLRLPRRLEVPVWTEARAEPGEWLAALEEGLRGQGLLAVRGGDFDAWDLDVRAGGFGSLRVLLVAEEHGRGRQLLRFRLLPRPRPVDVVGALGSVTLAAAAAAGGGWVAAVALATAGVALVGRLLWENGTIVERVRSLACDLPDTRSPVPSPNGTRAPGAVALPHSPPAGAHSEVGRNGADDRHSIAPLSVPLNGQRTRTPAPAPSAGGLPRIAPRPTER